MYGQANLKSCYRYVQILGLLPLGTSMDYESSASREKGCWDPKTQLAPFFEALNSDEPTPDFVVDATWRHMVATLGFSGTVDEETLAFWDQTLKDVYSGDEGRRKLRMSIICLLERDGLMLRVRDVKCPVYWLQVSLSDGNHARVWGPLTCNRASKIPFLARKSHLNTSSSSRRLPKRR
jgi:hypothetical protein